MGFAAGKSQYRLWVRAQGVLGRTSETSRKSQRKEGSVDHFFGNESCRIETQLIQRKN